MGLKKKKVYNLQPNYKEFIGKDNILTVISYDINSDKKWVDGHLIVTEKNLIKVENNVKIYEESLDKFKSFKSTFLISSGALEGNLNGEDIIILRYSQKYMEIFTNLCQALNHYIAGEKFELEGVKNVCKKCGKPLEYGAKICTDCLDRKELIKEVIPIIKKNTGLYVLIVFIYLLINLINLAMPYGYKVLVDDYILVKNRNIKGLVYIGILIGGGVLISAVLGIISEQIKVKLGAYAALQLRNIVYEKIQLLSVGDISKRKTGDLMNRVTEDVNYIRDFVQNQVTAYADQAILLIGACYLLFKTNVTLSLLILLPVPIVCVISFFIRESLGIRFQKEGRAYDKMDSFLQDILSGIRVVKSFGQEKKEIDRFKKVNLEFSNIIVSDGKKFSFIFPTLSSLLKLGEIMVLFYGSILVIRGQLKIGQLIQFQSYTSMIYGPLSWMIYFPKMLVRLFTSIHRVTEVFEEEPEVKNKKDAICMPINGEISIENVTFGYNKYEPILKNINLKIKHGEMIGLVGYSGVGKSTIINLLMRLYDVNSGSIKVDGVDIRDIDINNFRSNLGVVLQENFLFSGSVLDNIRYSKQDASLDEVIRAARLANAQDFIMKLPDGYNTIVGERGQTLSGGERQRIAIARAILCDPKILILDEATSSLDVETEEVIQEALSELIKGRTTIAIAHRLSTLKNADRLIVINDGEIYEEGTHVQLLRKKGIYYNLVMAQRQFNKITM